MLWLGLLCALLAALALGLLVKLALMRRAAREIREGLSEKLEQDTNTLLSISSRDRAMGELAEAVNGELGRLRSARHRFQQGDLELKEAVTNISHDLRTPLTAICGYLDLLDREEKSAAAAEYLEIIRERTETLNQLTDELFRYSVFTTASGDATHQPVSLNAAIERSVSAAYAALRGVGIEPEIQMPEVEVYRRLSENALARILENILSNAIKYSAGDLHIRLTEDGKLTFRNQAPELDETQVGQLFNRYYTVEAGAKSTGLGLSIAKTLTEQMGGTIAAEYRSGALCISLAFAENERTRRDS